MKFISKVVMAVCTVGLLAQVTGCSSGDDLTDASSKLAKANQRIATLEAQLAVLQQKGAAASVPVTSPSPTSETKPAEPPPSPVGQQWRYDASEEKMSGGVRKVASVESTNTVDFDFPYKGSQNGTITLRTDPQHGKDVMFRIERGQILCPSYDGCTVQVRFDDEKATAFSASGPADHSSTVIFLNDYSRFLAKLRKAKRVRVSVNIYQQGSPIFEFDVSGFDIEKYQAKS